METFPQGQSATLGVGESKEQAVVRDMMEVVRPSLSAKATVKVLEAGCGAWSHVGFGDNSYLVAMDIAEKQLHSHPFARERILGDIQTCELPPASFDVVMCWNVLEHLADPEAELRNFSRTVKPGGWVLLGMPNLLSTKGLVAELTPYWFHVFVYRKLLDDTVADPTGPFPTFLRWSMRPKGVERLARRHGFAVRFLRPYEHDFSIGLRRQRPWVGVLLILVAWLVRLFTFGNVDMNHSDCVIALQKT